MNINIQFSVDRDYSSTKQVSDRADALVDWSESSSMAALAVRWAEERRRKVEVWFFDQSKSHSKG